MREPMRALLMLLVPLFFAGCGNRIAGGTGVGNPTKGAVTVALLATDSAAGAPAARAAAKTVSAPRNPDGSFDIKDASGTIFTVRASFANVGRIRLRLPDTLDCSAAAGTDCNAGEVTIKGPFVSDLLTGAWNPDPGALDMPLGKYKSVAFRLEAGKSAEMGGHSLVVRGTFAYSGRTDRPFSISLDFDEDAIFQSDSGFAVTKGKNKLKVELDIAGWLSHADFTSCLDSKTLQLDADGGFAFDKEKGCGVLEQDVKDAVKTSGKLKGEYEGA